MKGTVAAIILSVVGIGLIVLSHNYPLPRTENQAVWLPSNYEIQNSRDVQPGTFKITKPSLDEFQKLVGKERVLVVYGESLNLDSPPYIEYWLSRKDGTFNYYRQKINPSGQQPYSGSFWTNWRIKFDGNNFILTPRRAHNLIGIGSFILLIAGIVWFVEIKRSVMIKYSVL